MSRSASPSIVRESEKSADGFPLASEHGLLDMGPLRDDAAKSKVADEIAKAMEAVAATAEQLAARPLSLQLEHEHAKLNDFDMQLVVEQDCLKAGKYWTLRPRVFDSNRNRLLNELQGHRFVAMGPVFDQGENKQVVFVIPQSEQRLRKTYDLVIKTMVAVTNQNKAKK